jgi:hypothetical protein
LRVGFFQQSVLFQFFYGRAQAPLGYIHLVQEVCLADILACQKGMIDINPDRNRLKS